jgi:hypothetical protein
VAAMIWLGVASAMTTARIAELRQETVDMFYHGFDNYMSVAFPEDEVGIRQLIYCSDADICIATSSILRTSHSRRAKSAKRRTQ